MSKELKPSSTAESNLHCWYCHNDDEFQMYVIKVGMSETLCILCFEKYGKDYPKFRPTKPVDICKKKGHDWESTLDSSGESKPLCVRCGHKPTLNDLCHYIVHLKQVILNVKKGIKY